MSISLAVKEQADLYNFTSDLTKATESFLKYGGLYVFPRVN